MEVRVRINENTIILEKRAEKPVFSYTSPRGWQEKEGKKIVEVIEKVGGVVKKNGYTQIIFTLDPLDQTKLDQVLATAKQAVSRGA